MSTTAITKPQNLVLAAITEHGPMTDAGLAEVLGGSPSSKNKTATALVKRGLLVVDGANYALPVDRTEGSTEDVTLESADEHNHEEVAANMAAEVEQANGEAIRVAAPLLATIPSLDLDETAAALVARLDGAEVRKDGSVRIRMTADEQDTLGTIADAVLDYDEATGPAKSAAKALNKWLVRVAAA